MRVEKNPLYRLNLIIACLGLATASLPAAAVSLDASAPQFAASASLFPALAANSNDADDCLEESDSASGNAQLRAMSMTMGATPRPAASMLAGLDSQMGNRAVAESGQTLGGQDRQAGNQTLSGMDELSSLSRARMQNASSLGGADSRNSQRVAAAPVRPAPATASRNAAASEPSSWVIQSSDKTLNGALTRWATAAGWQLVWELPVDYAVETRTVLPGTFEDAVGAVAKSMEGAEVPMKVVFNRSSKVLRLTAKNS